MPQQYLEMFSRNIGLISQEDQEKIRNSTVGIAGTGADGGMAAERIARLGVKKIKLSDPDKFDLSNINRQFGATLSTVGKNKCEAVAEEIKKIRNDIEIEILPEGVNDKNVDDFVKDCAIVLDEIEYTMPRSSIALHKAARKQGIDVIAGLNLGFGINIFRFTPEGSHFEDLIGFKDDTEDGSFRMESMVPNIPEYVDPEVVKKVLQREMYVPTMAPTIGLLSGYLSYIVLGEIIKKWNIPEVPEFFHLDMHEGAIKILKM